jgi:hypothetical protein
MSRFLVPSLSASRSHGVARGPRFSRTEAFAHSGEATLLQEDHLRMAAAGGRREGAPPGMIYHVYLQPCKSIYSPGNRAICSPGSRSAAPKSATLLS